MDILYIPFLAGLLAGLVMGFVPGFFIGMNVGTAGHADGVQEMLATDQEAVGEWVDPPFRGPRPAGASTWSAYPTWAVDPRGDAR